MTVSRGTDTAMRAVRVSNKRFVLDCYPQACCVRDGTRWRVYFRKYDTKTSICSYSARRTWELAASYVERALRSGRRIGEEA